MTRATVYDYRCPPGTAAKPLDPENAAPGEPARGDTAGKLNAAACREIEREAGKACGTVGDCVEAKKREQGWHSLGCDKLEGQKPVYDLGSPPSWIPKGRRSRPGFVCVQTTDASEGRGSGAFRGRSYQSPSDPDQIAEAIANGHAYEKHLDDFISAGVLSRAQLMELIRKIIGKARGRDVKKLRNDRTACWDAKTGIVVIHDPASVDGGTAFRPLNGREYFDAVP